MDEAMAAARSEADREVTAHQLDAFHKTFNFCMSCRQYTCPNCWNEVDARCQSCAPLALPEIAPAAFPSLMTLADATVLAEPAANGANGHDVAVIEAAAAQEAETPVGEPEAITDEAIALDAVAIEAIAEDVAAEPAAKATSQTAGLLHRFRPGQSLDDELAAFERERSDAGAQLAEPQAGEVATPSVIEEPVESVVAEPAAVVVAEPAAVVVAEPAAVVVAEPEAVVVAEPAAATAVQAEPEPAAPSAADVVEQPTWRITAPDTDSPGIGAPAPADTAIQVQANGAALPTAEPQWPAKPEWPAPQASIGLPFLGRPAQPQGGVDSLWAASNRELIATPPAPGRSTSGIQPCISCGLSLSATARFCRRCGTLQGG
jgi:hypothetical protein